MLVKERPARVAWKRPRIVGMDSNYRAGFVFSDGQHVGAELYTRIQGFGKRQKHTFTEVADLAGKALRRVDWSRIDVLVLEGLRHVKTGRRGTFSRRFNRRLSHWLYRASEQRIRQYCEEHGIMVRFKSPLEDVAMLRMRASSGTGETDQGDRFRCVSCGPCRLQRGPEPAQALEVVGAYGLGILKSNGACLTGHGFC